MVQAGKGSLTLFKRMTTTMSMLNSISDFPGATFSVRRSFRAFARGVLRLVNNAVAAVIAQRERQAAFAVLRSMTDRELRDVGISRNQIGPGIALAARERARAQRALARRP
jgi:uncharacterized protein YjiS (DUF1127 family)